MDKLLQELLAGPRREKRRGHELRVLTAMELLEAQREGELLPGGEETGALRHNAAILSRAVVRGNVPVFCAPEQVLRQWSAEKIAREMGAYRALAARVAPDCGDGHRVEQLLEQLRKEPEERIRWRVLKTFGVLPSEQRAREMTWGDYLYCAMELMLDREEELERLCPACRARATEKRCVACGRETGGETGENPTFDRARFEEMKTGG